MTSRYRNKAMKLHVITLFAVISSCILVNSIEFNSTKTVDKCQHDSCSGTFAVNMDGMFNIRIVSI